MGLCRKKAKDEVLPFRPRVSRTPESCEQAVWSATHEKAHPAKPQRKSSWFCSAPKKRSVSIALTLELHESSGWTCLLPTCNLPLRPRARTKISRRLALLPLGVTRPMLLQEAEADTDGQNASSGNGGIRTQLFQHLDFCSLGKRCLRMILSPFRPGARIGRGMPHRAVFDSRVARIFDDDRANSILRGAFTNRVSRALPRTIGVCRPLGSN